MQVPGATQAGVITPQGEGTSVSKKEEIVVITFWKTAYQTGEIDFHDLQTLMDLFDKKPVSEVKPKVMDIYNMHLAYVDQAPIGICILNLTAYMRDIITGRIVF